MRHAKHFRLSSMWWQCLLLAAVRCTIKFHLDFQLWMRLSIRNTFRARRGDRMLVRMWGLSGLWITSAANANGSSRYCKYLHKIYIFIPWIFLRHAEFFVNCFFLTKIKYILWFYFKFLPLVYLYHLCALRIQAQWNNMHNGLEIYFSDK